LDPLPDKPKELLRVHTGQLESSVEERTLPHVRRARGIFALLVSLVAGIYANAQKNPPLKLVATIPLPALHDGDFDHFAVDLKGHRLFLAAEENGEVDVLDAISNKLMHVIRDLKAPHSIVYRPDLKKLFVVDGDASEIKIYNSNTYQEIGRIPLRIDCDSMVYDPETHKMYVADGGREAHTPYSFISIVDTDSARKVGDIKIGSNRIEAMALESSGTRLFANITGKDSVGVIDLATNALIATWHLSSGDRQNVPLAFDAAHHRLFVVTRLPAKLVVLDSNTGKMIADLPAVALADDASFDPTQGRIYVAGNDFVDVFQEKDPDNYIRLAQVPSSYRAKTAIFVSPWHRYYLAVPHHEGHVAEVRVFDVVP
jgi:DNA-binding beta-propeller fold protein YncE